MEDICVTEHIKEICKQRGLSYYKLAQKSGIPHSSLNYMFKHHHVPTMNTLIKICKGLDISLSQFFIGCSDENSSQYNEFIKLWNILDGNKRELALTYMYGLANKIPKPRE